MSLSISLLLLIASCALSSCTLPNIVFILTDDQDVFLFGPNPMPKTKELITDAGMSFPNMFVTSPLCCPSRASILTGKYVHNHHTMNNSINGNCSSQAWQKAAETAAFPVHLKAQGYTTFFAGKYLNQYGTKASGGVEHVPPGWDDWNGLVRNSVYYNYTLSVNGKAEKHGDIYEHDYLTDVIKSKAINFLDHNIGSWKPFFLMLSTPACHQPFDSAPQYSKNFTDKIAPRTKAFNVHGKNKHWLIEKAKTPMPNDSIALADEYFRKRWRTLLSVDDMVEAVISKLEKMKQLDNTYIFFTSDNGYHLGQFSLPYDKRQAYEFDVRVPLMVRGPGIKPKSTSNDLVMSIDLAATFLDLAGIQPLPSGLDGIPLTSLLHNEEYNTLPLDMVLFPTPGFVLSLQPPKINICKRKYPFWSKRLEWKKKSVQFTPFRSEKAKDTKSRNTILYEHFGESTSVIADCPHLKDQGMYENIMNIDLASTFLDIANVKSPDVFDGSSFLSILKGETHPFRATVLVEYHGEHVNRVAGCPQYNDQGLYNCDSHCVCEDSWNNTYACIRYKMADATYKYCGFQDLANFVEVYNLTKDPDELNNIVKTASSDLLTKLSKRLADMSLCAGETCRSYLHP